MPKVSVIIPTYNRKNYVQETIDSVLSQTFANYELIVIDDGSTDDTGKILNDQYGDRIRYYWQENKGESVARNKGIELAQGQYVAFLDSDDLWLSEKLARQVPVLDAQPDKPLVFCQGWIIDELGQQTGKYLFGDDFDTDKLDLEGLYLGNKISGPSTTLIRRDVLKKVGGFDPQIRFGEDWDLWLRIALNHQIIFIPEPLVYIRRHLNTQCYLPSPENIERVLNDHLRLLHKAFAVWPGPVEAMTKLRNRALARQYIEAAFSSYAWDRWDQGCCYLEQAMALDPATWQNRELLAKQLLAYGLTIAETEGVFKLERMRTYLDGTFNNLPAGLNLSSQIYHHVLAKWCAEASFRSHLSGDYRAARYFAWHAFRTDRSLLKDRGMVQRFLRSIVG